MENSVPSIQMRISQICLITGGNLYVDLQVSGHLSVIEEVAMYVMPLCIKRNATEPNDVDGKMEDVKHISQDLNNF